MFRMNPSCVTLVPEGWPECWYSLVAALVKSTVTERYVHHLWLRRPTPMLGKGIFSLGSASDMLCAVTRGALPFLC